MLQHDRWREGFARMCWACVAPRTFAGAAAACCGIIDRISATFNAAGQVRTLANTHTNVSQVRTFANTYPDEYFRESMSVPKESIGTADETVKRKQAARRDVRLLIYSY